MKDSTQRRPLVTVAMVTYNSGKYVEFAIRSVLASSYKNFELIISDDCSTDDTWDIIQSFDDERITARRNKKNIGEYPNRNKCIDLSKGKYFIFIDGDDILIDFALNYAVFEMENHSDCVMACGYLGRNYIVYPFVLSPVQSYRFHYFGDSFFSNSFSQTFFKTIALKQVGGLSEKYSAGDLFIKAKLAATNNILIIYPLLGWWRETPGQASQYLSQEPYIYEQYELDKEILELDTFPLSEKEKQAILSRNNKALFKKLIKSILMLKFHMFFKLYNFFSIKAINNRNTKLPKYKLGGSVLSPLSGKIIKDEYDNYIS